MLRMGLGRRNKGIWACGSCVLLIIAEFDRYISYPM